VWACCAIAARRDAGVIDAALRAGAGAGSVARAFGYMCEDSVIKHRRVHLHVSVDEMKRTCAKHVPLDLNVVRDEGAEPDLGEALWLHGLVGGDLAAAQLMNHPAFMTFEAKVFVLMHERGTFASFFARHVDVFRTAARKRAKAEEVLAHDRDA
jgi:hypothetical protein